MTVLGCAHRAIFETCRLCLPGNLLTGASNRHKRPESNLRIKHHRSSIIGRRRAGRYDQDRCRQQVTDTLEHQSPSRREAQTNRVRMLDASWHNLARLER
jgi:hypothetical protein